MSAPEIIIIGTGPAGISAAWPLALAGHKVLLVDAGFERVARPDAARPSLAELRRQEGGWHHLLGGRLSALRDVGFASPKLRTATPPGFGEDYAEANDICCDDFRAVGALSVGGLSNVWGAAACAYDESDMAGWPISAAELAPSFRRLAGRIGLSGSGDDDLGRFQGADLPLQPALPVTGACAELMARYRSGRTSGLTLGRARNAVLSRDMGERGACDLGKACMWGCHTGAIYNAADEIGGLIRLPNVSLSSGLLVQTLVPAVTGGWRVMARDRRSGEAVTLTAPKVILAAGTLASTRLALAATGRVGETRRLVTAPAFAFALLQPKRLGASSEPQGFGMAQLAFRRALSPFPGDALFGSLYEADSFAVSDMVAGMPLTRRGAVAAMEVLMPALLVGLCYFPGAYSANGARLNAAGQLEITGGAADGFALALKRAGSDLAGDFRRLGAWLLPGSLQPFQPGAEVHYAGTLAMGDLTSRDGELVGAPGLFVADGSVLPGLSAKHHTFTMMANADRIGAALS